MGIQDFPSPRLVALLRLENPNLTYPYPNFAKSSRENWWVHVFSNSIYAQRDAQAPSFKIYTQAIDSISYSVLFGDSVHVEIGDFLSNTESSNLLCVWV